MLAALQAKLGGIDDHVFKAGSCLSGGVVGRGETCGALTGGMLAIGNEVGRERLEDVPQLRKARDIATELFISENTVKNHIRNILEKLHLHSRMEAVIYAVREKLLELE